MAGTPVELVLGVTNHGESAINVTTVTGSINAVSNFQYFMHNLTIRDTPHGVVMPGEETTISYSFTPLEEHLVDVDTADTLNLALTLFYEGGDRGVDSSILFATTFYNKTIGLRSAPDKFDYKLWSVYVVPILFVGSVLAFIAWQFQRPLRHTLGFNGGGRRRRRRGRGSSSVDGVRGGAASDGSDCSSGKGRLSESDHSSGVSGDERGSRESNGNSGNGDPDTTGGEEDGRNSAKLKGKNSATTNVSEFNDPTLVSNKGQHSTRRRKNNRRKKR